LDRNAGIPASFNGVYGLRPTMRRVPYLGTANSRVGSEAIECVIGPLSRSISGTVAFMKAVADGAPWDYDPSVVELPWKSEALASVQALGKAKKLSFAIMKWDNNVMPHPPVLRAVKIATDALKKAGHEGTYGL
jgi:amidase